MAGPSPRPGESNARGSLTVGVLTGLMPLLSLVVFGLALLLTAGVRIWVQSQGFFVQQRDAVLVLAPGLIIATIVYAVLSARALRRARGWLLEGSERVAAAAYWSLGATALIVLLPVLLALALPQHPAP